MLRDPMGLPQRGCRTAFTLCLAVEGGADGDSLEGFQASGFGLYPWEIEAVLHGVGQRVRRCGFGVERPATSRQGCRTAALKHPKGLRLEHVKRSARLTPTGLRLDSRAGWGWVTRCSDGVWQVPVRSSDTLYMECPIKSGDLSLNWNDETPRRRSRRSDPDLATVVFRHVVSVVLCPVPIHLRPPPWQAIRPRARG